MKRLFLISSLAVTACLGVLSFAEDAGPDAVDVATFDDENKLILPGDIDEWVFLGSSLGMGYSQAEFESGSPGMFQIARMEPKAYRVFRETGQFVDGTMIALHFFGSENDVSINRAGFVMGSQHYMEIHYKNSERFPDGFNFYVFQNNDTVAAAVALPNECVACHKKDGAYDGVFVQFYPVIHEYLPADIRARLSEPDGHTAH